jgi:RHS repeat-associated protein
MGYLGAQERRSDPTAGLIQMGQRPYDPSLGAFTSEDPVLGHLGSAVTLDRYPYAWDNPLNRYDLNGRDVCVPTPFGSACAEEAAEDVAEGAEGIAGTGEEAISTGWDTGEEVAGAAGSGIDTAWDWTASGRGWVGDRAQDFAKSDVGRWFGDRGDEVGRTFTCIAERVVQQPGPVGCQEEAEKWKPEPEAPEVPPSIPPPGIPGKGPVPNMKW